MKLTKITANKTRREFLHKIRYTLAYILYTEWTYKLCHLLTRLLHIESTQGIDKLGHTKLVLNLAHNSFCSVCRRESAMSFSLSGGDKLLLYLAFSAHGGKSSSLTSVLVPRVRDMCVSRMCLHVGCVCAALIRRVNFMPRDTREVDVAEERGEVTRCNATTARRAYRRANRRTIAAFPPRKRLAPLLSPGRCENDG